MSIDHTHYASIGRGLVLLVGVHTEDQPEDALKLADRVVGMRIFNDAEGKLNYSLLQLEAGSEVLAVSNFTVFGDVFKGRRPSFGSAASFERGKLLFDLFVEELRRARAKVETGVFGADMEVTIVNDGPVTLVIDTR